MSSFFNSIFYLFYIYVLTNIYISSLIYFEFHNSY